MSTRTCEKCEKTSLKGNKRSHSNIATRRRFHVNLQVKKTDGKKVRLCAKCVRTLAKQST